MCRGAAGGQSNAETWLFAKMECILGSQIKSFPWWNKIYSYWIIFDILNHTGPWAMWYRWKASEALGMTLHRNCYDLCGNKVGVMSTRHYQNKENTLLWNNNCIVISITKYLHTSIPWACIKLLLSPMFTFQITLFQVLFSSVGLSFALNEKNQFKILVQ